MDTKKPIEVILSTDGKMTLFFGADNVETADARFDKVMPLFNKMVKLMKDNDLQRKGYTPKPTTMAHFPSKEKEYADYPCPTCGEKVIKGTNKDGKKFEKCTTNKWNFAEKKAEGCSYIKWL